MSSSRSSGNGGKGRPRRRFRGSKRSGAGRLKHTTPFYTESPRPGGRGGVKFVTESEEEEEEEEEE
eukprot:1320088-Pyramimonas_sp.AAC.1